MSKTGDCRFKTPFNKSVPIWYWHNSKALRDRDRWLTVRKVEKSTVVQLLDFRSKEVIFDLPEHYGNWTGYFEKTRMCRLSGFLGRTTGPDGRTMCY